MAEAETHGNQAQKTRGLLGELNEYIEGVSIAFIGSTPYWIDYALDLGSENTAAVLGVIGIIGAEAIYLKYKD